MSDLTDIIHDAMLRNDRTCSRCPQPARGWMDIFMTDGELLSFLLCAACVTDIKVFIMTPPEIPHQDTSSDTMSETEGG